VSLQFPVNDLEEHRAIRHGLIPEAGALELKEVLRM